MNDNKSTEIAETKTAEPSAVNAIVMLPTALITPDFKNRNKWAIHFWNKKYQWEASIFNLDKKNAIARAKRFRAKIKKST